MHRAALHVGLIVLLLAFTPLTAAETHPTEDSPVAMARPGAPQVPDREGGTTGKESEPGPDGPERRMLERITRKYAAEIRKLDELARQVKGMELVDIQRRIEELKARQSEEELSGRIELARDAGDGQRVLELEQLSKPSTPPVTTPEFRPAPASVPVKDGGKGGER